MRDDSQSRIESPARVTFFDIVGPFHLASCLVAAGEVVPPGAQVLVYLVPNINGNYVSSELDFSHGGRSYSIRKQKSGTARTATLIWQLVKYLISRFFMESENMSIWRGHHTYLKPTILVGLSYEEMRRTRIVSFDEGVGTYTSHAERKRGEDKTNFALAKHWVRKILRSKLFVAQYCQSLGASRGRALRDAFAALDSYVFTDVGNIDSALRGTPNGPRAMVFAGSPLVENATMSANEYRRVLEHARSAFPQLRPIARPHPREIDATVYEESGYEVLTGSYSLESIAARLSPVVIVGVGSGGLATCSRFPGVQVYDLSREAVALGGYRLRPSRLDDLFSSVLYRLPS